ncbi:hypothetical protein BBK36DRAFT_2735 [Trichoderma citrinoviride]|uniref:F-box domain-containing protein n=1 Tax=Trichoderma citrinoviride TaxID=58853 RepID=A0A2T4BF03_9HYPO|nr:hypothetical protein BBK36DRAFT_2735 [Trichoderma citrinoviride]PTB67914.1 hypothetical protein BBK36DRAFT_2735 [Trichoderma citrinoviride]
MATTTFNDLFPEIVLSIMEKLPDVESLKSLVRVNKRIHSIFTTHRRGVVLHTVLENELGEDLFVHALVTCHVEKVPVMLPAFPELTVDSIRGHVNRLRQVRDDAAALQETLPEPSSFHPRDTATRITLRDADRMSHLWSKISELTDVFLEDCLVGESLHFYPMQDSLRRRPATVAERRRVGHALYLFHILSIFCKKLYLDVERTPQGEIDTVRLTDSLEKLKVLQLMLVLRFMAPWELYQLISLQAWVRRALHDLEDDCYVSERVMPYVLVQGLDRLHRCICGSAGDDKVLRTSVLAMKKEASKHKAHGFGMILSRGERSSWARKPREFERYRPFWGSRDRGGYRIWRQFESPRWLHASIDPTMPVAYDIMGITQGMLDIWSASLWDPARWYEIRRSMRDNMFPDPWGKIMCHWDSYMVGWRSALEPGMLPGVKSEARLRVFLRWIRGVLRLNQG